VAAGSWQVPKKELVSTLQVLLQTRRLQVAQRLPQAAALERELHAFRVRITESAHEMFGAERERDHDDLVMALALAAWVAERVGLPRLPAAGTERPTVYSYQPR
jgi:hypothetical protein